MTLYCPQYPNPLPAACLSAMRALVSALIAAAITFAPLAEAVTPCLGGTPLIAAETFYKEHRDFSLKDPVTFSGLVTSRFYQALVFEHNCKRGEVCAIDYDLWTAAQDGEIAGPIDFRLVSSTERRAVVGMHYTFALDNSRRQQQTVLLHLEKRSTDACWMIADLLDPKGQSAVGLIEGFRATHGGSDGESRGMRRDKGTSRP